jgi:two-component system sensor histidine kinase HydH
MAIFSRTRLLSSVVRIAGSESLSFNSRLKSIAKIVNDSFDAESTAIYILDEERRYLSEKIPHDSADEVRACCIPVGEGGAGSCAARSVVTHTAKMDLHADEFAEGTGRTMLCLPIPPGKKICGVFSIALHDDSYPDAEDTEVLQDVSAVLGSLIQGRNIAERSNKRVQNLMALNELAKIINKPIPFRILPSYILKACHRFANSCCTVMRIVGYGDFSPGIRKRCRRKFHSGLSSFLELESQYAAKTLATGMPFLATDIIAGEEFPPSCISVPLRYESRVTGTITFFGKLTEDGSFLNFDEEDRELFESMAATIAATIEVAVNNRQAEILAAENARKIRELSLLYKISNAMHSTIRLNDLICLALDTVVSGEAPIFERAMLFLVNERAGVIQGMLGVNSETSRGVIRTAEEGGDLLSARWEISGEDLEKQQNSEFSRRVKESRLPLDKNLNLSSTAIIEKRLIHVNDVSREKRIDQEFVERFGITEFASVPLMVKDEAVGLVIVDNPLTRKNITRDDLRFLQLLLNQAGIAIENSMLYSRIEDANRDFREVQQRLIQGEKLAAIGEMAASIAHELKGPLVSIGGFARRLEQKFTPDSTEWKYADTIAREVDRLEKMLTDTLFFSKKTTITCSPCNINAIISESLAILAGSFEERNIKVKVRFHPGVESFYGDFLQLKQVFINLFANASEAMKNGGSLSVTVAPARLEGEDALYVKILDTGGGIPLEILNNIFNPFFTTKEYGTGLGLPISHRIVVNHGGKILVYNRIGVGAQFKVILPIRPKIPETA